MKTIFLSKIVAVSSLLILSTLFMANEVHQSEYYTAASFKKFVSLFPKKDLPYKIDAVEMNAWIDIGNKRETEAAPEFAVKPQQLTRISSSFDDFIPELKNGMFSRMGPDIFIPQAVVQQGGARGHVVLIYSRARGYSERKGTQYLAVFSPKGKRLSEMLIAKSNGYESFTGCVIKKSASGALLVTTTEYTNTWKNEEPRYGNDNYIVSVTPKKSATHILTASGDLEAIRTP